MKKYILLFILTWSAVTLLPQITHGMWGFGEKSTEETKASRGIKLVDKGGTDTDRRIALVIGNGSYKSSPLRNPVNDAVDVASKLKRLGFDVTDGKDMTRKEMRSAIRVFGDNLKKGGVGLFYYAGHGMQVKGKNYLIPVGVDIQSEEEVEFEAIDAGLVMRKMERAGNTMNMVFLDACRDNPFARSFRTGSRGLAQMDAPSGSLIVYSTAPGSIAADGKGRNGIFTKNLLLHLSTPGLEVGTMLRMVRVSVEKDTDGKQVPWESSSLKGSFYFVDTKYLQQQGSEVAGRIIERNAEIERLRELERQSKIAREKEQAEIARKEEELAKLDTKIQEMKERLGTKAADTDDSLDAMFAMVEDKENQAKRLEELRRKREAEEQKRLVEIERLKNEQARKRKEAIMEDISKYKRIVSSEYGRDMKEAAWNNLVSRYPEASGLIIGDIKGFRLLYRIHKTLRSSYRDLSVSQVQSMSNISIRKEEDWGFECHSTINHVYHLSRSIHVYY